MPKIAYAATNFPAGSLEIIAHAIGICEDYAAQGYNLTLRQLYYQFVSRDLLPNTMQSYKRLGSIVNDARLAGLIDWDHLEDRTRNLSKVAMWDSPQDIVDAVAAQYRTRLWDGQDWYVEVWVEKEALADVVSRPADRWLVPYFPCRGYVSQSEMWRAAQRLLREEKKGKRPLIIHLGDHDPSGIDMTRDIQGRLGTFGSSVEVNRIALNMPQVEQYQPPPNPAKVTDSRAADYMEIYGDESWELDALIEGEILDHLDRDQWDSDHEAMEADRSVLVAVSEHWGDVAGLARASGWMSDGEDRS